MGLLVRLQASTQPLRVVPRRRRQGFCHPLLHHSRRTLCRQAVAGSAALRFVQQPRVRDPGTTTGPHDPAAPAALDYPGIQKCFASLSPADRPSAWMGYRCSCGGWTRSPSRQPRQVLKDRPRSAAAHGVPSRILRPPVFHKSSVIGTPQVGHRMFGRKHPLSTRQGPQKFFPHRGHLPSFPLTYWPPGL